ncbi:MAG: RluA family pseudouridine synthase [Proteobacteria bacterium]|nr:RluA family pseudouridine synthase [Pseudomonadota bacterium]
MNLKTYIVEEVDSGSRIDQYLASKIPNLSRRKIRTILDIGGCYVNNKRVHIASRKVNGGDKVRVEYSEAALSTVKQKKFLLQTSDIVFNELNLIAINKPPGLPSQATRDQDVMHAEISLRNWIKESNLKIESLILVHRLDKETSGVLLFATTSNVATWVTDQFKQRTTKKEYLALCYGIPKEKTFEVDCHLSDIDNKSGKVSIVRSGGKQSKTSFQLIALHKEKNISLIHCFPETGRSHQIRVHLESLGLPILGDKKYGARNLHLLEPAIADIASRHHMLHARSLQVSPNPIDKPVLIRAIPPESFLNICQQLNFTLP